MSSVVKRYWCIWLSPRYIRLKTPSGSSILRFFDKTIDGLSPVTGGVSWLINSTAKQLARAAAGKNTEQEVEMPHLHIWSGCPRVPGCATEESFCRSVYKYAIGLDVNTAHTWRTVDMFQQLATLLITRQVVGNIKEAVVPYVIDKFRLMRICVRAVEAMSPDTLQNQMSQFECMNAEEKKLAIGRRGRTWRRFHKWKAGSTRLCVRKNREAASFGWRDRNSSQRTLVISGRGWSRNETSKKWFHWSLKVYYVDLPLHCCSSLTVHCVDHDWQCIMLIMHCVHHPVHCRSSWTAHCVDSALCRSSSTLCSFIIDSALCWQCIV